ncbi:hypothetical protein RvY_15546-2 [Ramazzottius varieornatus]|uniref:Uncharacterized protein n=1 Tax=Ramazzottius varieornatus TaxID=947166 RepID=A0A1D1VVA7_RAMVA|nr:hypothetical protein RvY_15546-2 [Ramazzottius varieornatus]
MMTYQRFIWTSPRKTADVLNDPSCPFSLAHEVRNAVQELVAARWNSSRPLWSNQDCLRLDEKKGMDMLKEYFLSIGNACPSGKEVPSTTDADKQEEREDKESRDALSARLQSAQNSPHAGKITGAASRTGPYSARNRHVQILVLPAYRGVYTRIHDEWKAKVEKTAQEEEEMKKQKEATRALLKPTVQKSGASKTEAPQPAITVLRKPEVQKIPLRKVVKPLKPLDRQERIQSHAVFPRSSEALLGLSQRPSKTKLHHRKSKQKLRRNRTRKLGRISRPSLNHLSATNTPVDGAQQENEDDGSEVSSRCSEVTSSPTIDPDHTNISKTGPTKHSQHSGKNETLRDMAEHYFLLGGFPSVVNTILYEDPPTKETDGQESVPRYAMKLVRHYPRPPENFPQHYSTKKRLTAVKHYEETFRQFISRIKHLRHEVFASAWKRYQHRQTRKSRDWEKADCFGDANHQQQYLLRLHRIFRYLEDQQTDAFTQPKPLGKPDRHTRQHAAITEVVTEAEKIWKKRSRRLLTPTSPDYPSAGFGNDEDEEEEEDRYVTKTTS